MINLCNTACILKMAACLYRSRTKEKLHYRSGGKLRLGKQMRQCYLPGAWLDNEDKSSDQRAIS